MIELAQTVPDVRVDAAEYQRLLGYPAGHVLEGRGLELAEWAREWYREHGRPWVYARQAESLSVAGGLVTIDGATFTSDRLRKTLSDAEADSAILVAASAGPELELEARKLWEQEKPDEYFFLEVYGSAVVEHLITNAGAGLCSCAEKQGMAVLPHYSPGYAGWDISEQRRLLDLVSRDGALGPLEVLDSGALKPKKSLLAVFGVTAHAAHLKRLTNLVPCHSCSLAGCEYRRATYARRRSLTEVEGAAPAYQYTVNIKALKRWASERLSLTPAENGGIEARFRYEGTTCSNMGRPLAFDYLVKLGTRADAFPIVEQHCAPAPDDTGYTYMCQYIREPERLTASIETEKPLAGRPLSDVLAWRTPNGPAGCYCEPESRLHKWRLVFETIHYALTQMGRHGIE